MRTIHDWLEYVEDTKRQVKRTEKPDSPREAPAPEPSSSTSRRDPKEERRDEEKGVIAWRIKFRNGKKDMDLLAPITTKPWGKHIPQLKSVEGPTQEQRDSQLLYNEPKYIRMDDGDIHTLKSNGLKMKLGVHY